ncbi:MAG TPA: aldehyde dehydrogenase family protein [Patescibacteria group bacterium]|nr:aldehyde dehydrogenase family protein [Patescibacteria group bacterium]
MSRKTKKTYIISTNPAKNYEVIGKVAVSTNEEIRKAVENAHSVKRTWKEMGIAKRITLLRNIYEEIFKRREELVKLIVAETGKTVPFAFAEIDRHSQDVKWFLDHGEKILSDVVTYEDAKSIHRIVHEPRGVTAVITPWNHPYGMFAWGVMPNLIAGNTVLYKISKESILVGKLLEEIVNSGNLPQGVFAEIYGDAAAGETLTDQTIDYLWFTGSTAVGKKLYQKAAKKFIGAVMELGGSNPAIMFDDVSVDDFIEKIYTKRFSTTCGQSCDSLKRLLVQEPIFDEVVEKLKKRFEKIVIGDPIDPKTNIASLVAKKQVDLLEEQVKDAVKKGAKIVIGGKRPKNFKGAYYLPTLLTNIKNPCGCGKRKLLVRYLSLFHSRVKMKQSIWQMKQHMDSGQLCFQKIRIGHAVSHSGLNQEQLR